MNYITGKEYIVDCIFAYPLGDTPVIGIAHRDPELGVDTIHYHIDDRFVSDDDLRKYYPFKNIVPIVEQDECLDRRFKLKKMCYRSINRSFKNGGELTKMQKFRDKLKSDSFKLDMNCKICPHRNILLEKIKSKGGIITCPMHGLKFDENGCIL